MYIQIVFELALVLDAEKFDKILSKAYPLESAGDDEYIDRSLVDKGITVVYLDICLKPVGDTVQHLILRESNRSDAAIIAGSPDGGSYLAFLVIKREDGECIFELESFRMLSIHYTREDEHYGVFVAFNSFPNMLHRDHCIAYPNPKLFLLDQAKSEKTEPKPDDGGITEDNTD